MRLDPERPLDPPEERRPVCPVCESACETLYRREDDNSIVGCDRCLYTEKIWNWMEEEE